MARWRLVKLVVMVILTATLMLEVFMLNWDRQLQREDTLESSPSQQEYVFPSQETMRQWTGTTDCPTSGSDFFAFASE